MTERTETCQNCRWWDQWTDHPNQGLCRVAAPASTNVTDDPEEASPRGLGWCSYPEWPVTYDNDWCGEFAARTPLAVVGLDCNPASEPASEMSEHDQVVRLLDRTNERLDAMRLKVAEVDSKLLSARQDIASASERAATTALCIWVTVFVLGALVVGGLVSLLAR